MSSSLGKISIGAFLSSLFFFSLSIISIDKFFDSCSISNSGIESNSLGVVGSLIFRIVFSDNLSNSFTSSFSSFYGIGNLLLSNYLSSLCLCKLGIGTYLGRILSSNFLYGCTISSCSFKSSNLCCLSFFGFSIISNNFCNSLFEGCSGGSNLGTFFKSLSSIGS